ncbi:putative transcriptional regulator [Bosea lupini]|uniref:Putative transcriptional regulator n=1 Tax=Bosea lupini TaxID=1036779 RepID=A0A1H8AG71_9HYPH|nr:helix-turn-helix transcriptional regulator [Bosea lupini]SEM69611.1 putative transcriptional regulator [Bosea lupini]
MNLASYLAQNKLKPTQFAARAGVPASTITRILSGARRPLFDTVVKISEATGGEVALSDFVQPADAAPESTSEPTEADCPAS